MGTIELDNDAFDFVVRRCAGVPQRCRGIGENVSTGERSKTTKAKAQRDALEEQRVNFEWFAKHYKITPGKGGNPGPAMLPAIIRLVKSLDPNGPWNPTKLIKGSDTTNGLMLKPISPAPASNRLVEYQEPEEDYSEMARAPPPKKRRHVSSRPADDSSCDEEEEEEEDQGKELAREMQLAALYKALNSSDDEDEA